MKPLLLVTMLAALAAPSLPTLAPLPADSLPTLAPPPADSLPQDEKQEKPTVPKDSIELTVIGCLKGRVLSTVANRPKDTESGPFVGAHSFRLAGKREVMDEVKKHDGHLVEVVGIVKRSALDDKGVKIGPATIRPASPSSGRMPSPAENVDVMDATAVRLRSTACGS
jgi:hypothetical protein